MKKIWIVNYYTRPPKDVTNPRHLAFAHHLQRAGYEVTIFCAGYVYDKGIDLVPAGKKYIKIKYEEYDFIHIKVKHYKGNGLNRMISIFQFAWRIFILRNHFHKPNIILHNIHAPFDYPVSWCAKWRKAKYIVEAWDLWPESFIDFGLINASNPIVKVAYWFEKKLYEKADQIVFSFEGGIDYINQKKWNLSQGGRIRLENVNYINNGVDLDEFDINKEQYQIDDPDLKDESKFRVIYLGSINLVNDLKRLIVAAKLLQSRKDIVFLIYGDGNQRDSLEYYCKKERMTNVLFKQRKIEHKYVPYVLSCSSLNILNYKEKFGKYGSSSGKLFQYLASGKPICCNVELGYDLIKKYDLGFSRNFRSEQEYFDSILLIREMNLINYNSMCARVRSVANQFDYKILSKRMIEICDNLLNHV